MLNRHVYIIGMPGSGKSSLGRRVASNLGLPFIDTDQRIEQSVGCSTSDIFAHYGEQAFRNAETNMLIELSREQGSIVSTGGGLVLRDVNREIMRNTGVIVLLDRPLEELWATSSSTAAHCWHRRGWVKWNGCTTSGLNSTARRRTRRWTTATVIRQACMGCRSSSQPCSTFMHDAIPG